MPYETLSYCWGHPSDHAAITVDGCRLLVPRNLEKALWALLWRRRLDEGVERVELVRVDTTVVKAGQVHHGSTRVQGAFGGWHRQRRPESHTESQGRRVQVTSLRVI